MTHRDPDHIPAPAPDREALKAALSRVVKLLAVFDGERVDADRALIEANLETLVAAPMLAARLTSAERALAERREEREAVGLTMVRLLAERRQLLDALRPFAMA